MPTLQLKYGDLTLDILEAWGESLDWPVQAEAVPGSWAGCAFARRPAPRRITVQGFIGRSGGDPSEVFRADFDEFLRSLNQTFEDSKRSDNALWELWAFDDRCIRCRPISFTYEHLDGLPWAARFTAQFVAPDPRWYSSASSNVTAWGLLTGTSNWCSIGISQPSTAPTEPWCEWRGSGATSFALVNRHKNVLRNGNLRTEPDTETSGAVPYWGHAIVSEVRSGYRHNIYGEDFGEAWITQDSGTATSQNWYQDVPLTEPGSQWTFTCKLGTKQMAADSYAFLRLHCLGANDVSIDVIDSSTWTSAVLGETTLTASGLIPDGTQWVRAIIYCRIPTGGYTHFYWKWAQLERGPTATTFEYKEPDRLEFQPWAAFGTSAVARLDHKEGVASWALESENYSSSNLLHYLTDGNFWSLDPGANEILLEAGSPTGSSQSLDIHWNEAYWGK